MAGDEPPHISIAAGIAVGLVSSFVQSLGLTIQRLSHVSNERLPPAERKRDWKRPLWLGGFAIFILSNVFGTIFQIGALPIVVLGPLGAVSLLWNAFFAKLILGDKFSMQLVVGTFLIAGGAVLIGIFGVVPEQTHTLPELVALYRRPAFVAWVCLLAFVLLAILALAHVSEWRMHRRIAALLPPGTPTPRPGRRVRRWSAGATEGARGVQLAQPGAAEQASGGGGQVKAADYGAAGEREPLLPKHSSDPPQPKHAHFAFPRQPSPSPSPSKPRPPPLSLPSGLPAFETPDEILARFEQTRVWLAVAYGATSGTLSGLCLLFTKTGIELLILSVTGKNQFGHVEPWLIVATLLITELFQLSYLNRALRLSGPTLVCPLAFCFYNTSSIVSGLIYYRQVDALSRVQVALVALGSAVLLAGVWVVSVKMGEGEKEKGGEEEERLLTEEPETADEVCSTDEEEDLAPYRPRGFSIGLGAASPGFEIRPSHSYPLRRAHTSAFPSSSTFAFPSPSADVSLALDQSQADERTPLANSTASLPADPSKPHRRAAYQHHAHRRSGSLSGAPYVGLAASGCASGEGEGLGLREVVVHAPAPSIQPEEERPKEVKKKASWWQRLRRQT
ncbi:hypothetical protein JCM8097_006420 [Rhodosporidiobolus ruineniae]